MSVLELALQVFINGILFGANYGIAALGLSVIFGTMRIIFFAQGTMIIFFAYVCFWLNRLLGMDPYLSLILVVPLAFLFGVVFYKGIFHEAALLEDKNISLLLAVGIMYVMENLMLLLWSPNPRFVTTAYTSYVLRFGNISVSMAQLLAFASAIVAATFVFGFLNNTLIGTAVRATSEDPEAAKLVGIDIVKVNFTAFSVGVALTGIAGVAFATVYSFDPQYGSVFAIKALIALTLGGMGNIYGALFGGIFLGVVESFASYLVGSGWTEAISYATFILVLIFRPYGLLGKAAVK